jgi:predicted nuclease of restriction endonuclease-like (RecB) superfamily
MPHSGKPMTRKIPSAVAGYEGLLSDVVRVIEEARRAAARSVNAVMTATYWLVGRRIVEEEQGGSARAAYGEALLERLAADLTQRFGRGFSRQNLQQMRLFYLAYPPDRIRQTVSGKSLARIPGPEIRQTPSSKSSKASPTTAHLTGAFPLSWSHYVRLLGVGNEQARSFYEAEALRGGWSVRQLDRQIDSQFYERTALSRNKVAMLTEGAVAGPEDAMTPEAAIKDPYVLEFLGLKDEYSESELEAALIAHLETFLLELGDDFAFVGRQRRLRLDDEWYRVDLVFFHRRLRCLVVIDLKLGKFTHADAGQMHLYLSYAREHWMRPGENPPVGLILCASKGEAVARYALEGLPNKVLAAEYRTALPKEKVIATELEHTRQVMEGRHRLVADGRTPKRTKAKSRRRLS